MNFQRSSCVGCSQVIRPPHFRSQALPRSPPILTLQPPSPVVDRLWPRRTFTADPSDETLSARATFHSSLTTVYVPRCRDWHLVPIHCHRKCKHTRGRKNEQPEQRRWHDQGGAARGFCSQAAASLLQMLFSKQFDPETG